MIRPEDLLVDLEPACIKSARYENNGKNITIGGNITAITNERIR